MRYLRGFDERFPDRPVSGIGTLESKHAANEQYYDAGNDDPDRHLLTAVLQSHAQKHACGRKDGSDISEALGACDRIIKAELNIAYKQHGAEDQERYESRRHFLLLYQSERYAGRTDNADERSRCRENEHDASGVDEVSGFKIPLIEKRSLEQ